jgi:hypothetical protein
MWVVGEVCPTETFFFTTIPTVHRGNALLKMGVYYFCSSKASNVKNINEMEGEDTYITITVFLEGQKEDRRQTCIVLAACVLH